MYLGKWKFALGFQLAGVICCVPLAFEAWITTNVRNKLPAKAVAAGKDSDGSAIYVGRAWHNDELFPAKVIPARNACYITVDGKEQMKENYDILTGNGFAWVPAQNGEVPDGSVQGGKHKDGAILYVGRVEYEGTVTPGKIVPNHNCMYIAFNGNEKRFLRYETLVKQGCDCGSCGCECQ